MTFDSIAPQKEITKQGKQALWYNLETFKLRISKLQP